MARRPPRVYFISLTEEEDEKSKRKAKPEEPSADFSVREGRFRKTFREGVLTGK